MKDIIDFVLTHKAWIFEGIGVAILGGLVALVWRRRDNQKGSKRGVVQKHIVAGGDVVAGNKSEESIQKRKTR